MDKLLLNNLLWFITLLIGIGACCGRNVEVPEFKRHQSKSYKRYVIFPLKMNKTQNIELENLPWKCQHQMCTS